MDRVEVARRWVEVLSGPSDDGKAALAEAVAEAVVTVSPLGEIEGRTEVLADLGRSPLAEHLARATWSERAEDGQVEVTGTFTPAAPVGGVTLRFSFDDADRISRVETGILPAPPPEPAPIRITEPMRDAVNGALANGTPIMVAYVDHEGQPQLSFRGSTQAYDDARLAVWVRNPSGGLLAAIGHNPRVAFFYRDPVTRVAYQFQGRAHAESDPEIADRVYTNSPEGERNLDAQRKGVPVLVDLDRIQGRDATGPVLMTRDAGSS